MYQVLHVTYVTTEYKKKRQIAKFDKIFLRKDRKLAGITSCHQNQCELLET